MKLRVKRNRDSWSSSETIKLTRGDESNPNIHFSPHQWYDRWEDAIHTRTVLGERRRRTTQSSGLQRSRNWRSIRQKWRSSSFRSDLWGGGGGGGGWREDREEPYVNGRPGERPQLLEGRLGITWRFFRLSNKISTAQLTAANIASSFFPP